MCDDAVMSEHTEPGPAERAAPWRRREDLTTHQLRAVGQRRADAEEKLARHLKEARHPAENTLRQGKNLPTTDRPHGPCRSQGPGPAPSRPHYPGRNLRSGDVYSSHRTSLERRHGLDNGMPITSNVAWDERLEAYKGRNTAHYIETVKASASRCAVCPATSWLRAALSLTVDITEGRDLDGISSLTFDAAVCHLQCQEPGLRVHQTDVSCGTLPRMAPVWS